MGSAYQFHSWRVFVIVCALPCVSSVVALTFMPESPRFLLEVNFFLQILKEATYIGKSSVLVLGNDVCLFGRYTFPSCYQTMEDLVSWRYALNSQCVKNCLVAREH